MMRAGSRRRSTNMMWGWIRNATRVTTEEDQHHHLPNTTIPFPRLQMVPPGCAPAGRSITLGKWLPYTGVGATAGEKADASRRPPTHTPGPRM